MSVKFSQHTPAEPNWEEVITAMRADCAPDEEDPKDVVFKFSASRISEVSRVLDRVLEANNKVGTPAEQQTPDDNTLAALRRLAQHWYAQAAVVSWVVPGVYVIWSAYKRSTARAAEYRVAIWVMKIDVREDVDYLVGNRKTGIPSMFFRRQHIVRAVHAGAPVYHKHRHHLEFGDRTYMYVDDGSPFADFVTDEATMTFQSIDYEIAEMLGQSGDIDEWQRQSQNDALPRAVQAVLSETVTAYAEAKLKEYAKL